MHPAHNTLYTGTIGTIAPIGAAVISLDPILDFELRVLSLVLGLLVGFISLVKLIYDCYHDWKSRHGK
jgi:hypothetical protein